MNKSAKAPSYFNFFQETFLDHLNRLFEQVKQYNLNEPHQIIQDYDQMKYLNHDDNYSSKLTDHYQYHFIKSATPNAPNLLFLVFLIISLLESAFLKLKARRVYLFKENHFFHLIIKCKCLKILLV